MLRGGDGISARGVQHNNAAARGRLDVHIIHADAGAADRAQGFPGLQDRCGHFRFAADDDGAEPGDDL